MLAFLLGEIERRQPESGEIRFSRARQSLLITHIHTGYSVTQRQWIFAAQPEPVVQSIAQSVGVTPLIARLMINRGLATSEEIDRFLSPSFDHLHDPFLFNDMDKAVGRIKHAIAEGELIRIQGDYDVDGTTSTALLTYLFRLLQANHSFNIPSREGDGYGLSIRAVEKAAADGVKLLITVDNGVGAIEPIKRAVALGIDVIVTDHHTIGEELPPAVAIVHPKLPGQRYPFRDLCGCGVAFKLALGLMQSFGIKQDAGAEWQEFRTAALALCAMASICDVVPLVGENRVLTMHGLEALAKTRQPGLRALCQVAGVEGIPSAKDVAFKLGPRINAAGRMNQERVAAELLMARDTTEAWELAMRLDDLNKKRQSVERGITLQAKAMYDADESFKHDSVTVMAGDGWAPGVIGIVAARMVEHANKPAIVMSIDGDGTAKGSGRSTANFNLFNAVKTCEDLTDRFGGHRAAIGLSLPADRLPEFRKRVNLDAREHTGFVPGKPTLSIDSTVEAAELCAQLAKDIVRLAPFGEGNPEPLLALEGARVVGKPKLIGRSSQHLSFHVVPEGGRGYRAIAFSQADSLSILERSPGINMAFVPKINTWKGSEELELEVKDVTSAG